MYINKIKIFIVCFLTFFVCGCGNKYYLQKKIDYFSPKANEQFNILNNSKSKEEYYNVISNSVAKTFNGIPMKYLPSSYVPYLVYFSYSKRSSMFPVFRLTILQKNNNSLVVDHVVYDSIVYAYNFNSRKSLVASLKILSNDIVNKAYNKGSYIKVKEPQKDIDKFFKDNITPVNISNLKSSSKEHIRYQLYDNEYKNLFIK